MRKISVVTVTYNSSETIQALISSLLFYLSEIIGEIIVIDNKSSDDTVSVVKSLCRIYPRIRLIENKTNFGYRKAANLGLALAANEIVLLTNPDILLTDNTLVQCYREIIRWQDVAVCYPRVRTVGRGRFDHHLTRVVVPFLFEFPEIYGNNSHKLKPVTTQIHVGPVLFVRRSALLEVGGYDEGVFMYGEEEEAYLKLSAIKLRILYVPLAKVEHEGSGSSEQIYGYQGFYSSQLFKIAPYLYFKYYDDTQAKRALWWAFYFLCALEWTIFTMRDNPLRDAYSQFKSRRSLPKHGFFRSAWHIKSILWTHVFKLVRFVSIYTSRIKA